MMHSPHILQDLLLPAVELQVNWIGDCERMTDAHEMKTGAPIPKNEREGC